MQFYLAIAGGLGIFIVLIFLARVFLKPRGRRTLLNFVSWLGFALIIPGLMAAMLMTVLEFEDLIRHPDVAWWGQWEGPGSGIIYLPAMISVYVGTILMLLGGLIARPRHFSMIFLVIGISCILAFYGFLAPNMVWDINLIWVMITIFPGIACIVGSLILKEREKQIVDQTKAESKD